jgi:ferrous iron transport protein B
MELPSYHLPTFNGIMMHAWHRLKDFILRAGKTILTVIAVMYVLQMITIPVKDASAFEKNPEVKRISVMEIAGKAIAPALGPMGIEKNNWHAGVALLSGLFAKEAIVGSMQSLYKATNGKSQLTVIRQHFGSGVSAFAFLLFILLYSPCAAALTMLWKEHGKGWMLFAFVFLTLQAWLVATLFYQIMVLALNPLPALFWILVVFSTFLIEYWVLFIAGRKYVRVV